MQGVQRVAEGSAARAGIGSATGSGIGLHTGTPVKVRLRRNAPGAGISFVRTDVPGSPAIPADLNYVVAGRRCTSLREPRSGATVKTVEHFLAAAFALAARDLVLEVDGPELPAGDGSARWWVELIRQVGLEGVDLPGAFLDADVIVTDDSSPGTFIAAYPAPVFSATYVFVPPYAGEAAQLAEYVHQEGGASREYFVAELAPARTPAFVDEVASLQREGLGLGGTIDQVALLGREGPANRWRFPDEPARHKLVDLLGDLSLAGPLRARIVAVRTGHRHNLELARRLWPHLRKF